MVTVKNQLQVQGHVQEYLFKMQKQVIDDVREIGEPCQYKNKSSWIYPPDAFFVLREKLDPRMLYYYVSSTGYHICWSFPNDS